MITEKPSVALALSAVLGATERKDGYLEGNGYLSYDNYLNFGGTAEPAVFPRLEYRARKLIDRLTQKRVQPMAEIPEGVLMCMTELVNAMDAADPTRTAVSPSVSSFSNDGYSETYAKPVTADSLEQAYVSIILEYLETETDDFGTPLLYLGVDG